MPVAAYDRTESGVISSTPPHRGITDRGEKRYGDLDPKKGPLLGEDKEKVAKEAYRTWRTRDPSMARRLAQWEVNEYRREGVSESRVMREDDRWIAWVPRWVKDDPERVQAPNKAARLCRRLTSQMFADPPAPEAVPASGEDEDVDAAEVSTRVLVDIQSEANLDDVGNLRHAFDLASTYDSGFIRYFIDPRGGGRVPLEVEAGYDPGEKPQAANLMVGFLGTPGSPPREAQHILEAEVDPATGLPWKHKRMRYVRPNGTLTEVRGEAATRWVPTIEAEVLTGRNVRMIPHTARDISKARGCQVAFYETWGSLKDQFPDIAKLPDEKKQALFRFRPRNAETILAEGVDPKMLGTQGSSSTEEDRDEALIFCLITYYKACDQYPEGLYLYTCGDSYVAYTDNWTMEDEGLEEPLLIPIVQVKQFQEGTNDPYGRGLMRIVGSSNDLRAQQIASFLDHLDWLENRKGFIPTMSNLTSSDMEGEQRYLKITPNGDPKWEDIPDYPSMAVEMFKMVGDEMDDDSGMGPLGDSLLDAESGRQAYAAVSQAHAGLSEPRQYVTKAYVRGCRIQLQLIRAFFPEQQKVRWLGEDNRHKVESWSVADLRTTRDVKLAPGTLTGLTPAQKTQLLEHYAELKAVPPEELREALAKNLGGTITLQDDPIRNRVRGQLADWGKGPPKDWQPQQDGAEDPALRMWEPVPSDILPEVAPIRAREIIRFMQTYRYRRWPKAWRAVVDAELERMIGSAPAPAAPAQPAVPADAVASPEEPQPFGIAPMDTVPPEVAGALPPEQAGLPSANVGQMPVEITRGA